jgi:hypothetical protein
MGSLRDNLFDFFASLLVFLAAAWSVVFELVQLMAQPICLGMLAWIVFWTFGVNWVKLHQTLRRGGCVALILIGLAIVLVWGTVDPPAAGQHSILGLQVNNYVGKTVYVTGLFCVMFLCGTVQLTGCCARCCNFEDEPVELESHGSPH